MITTIDKQYKETEYKNFTVYGGLAFKLTNVFWEYFALIISLQKENKEQVINKIKNYKKVSKSEIYISYSEDKIEFFKPNKSVFPEFYIIFKDENR